MTNFSLFAPRGDLRTIEEGTVFAPKFSEDGLILAVAQDADTGEILMVAYMNSEALEKTISTREAWFWSRSRKRLWHKGAESGNVLDVMELRIDCDQDCLVLQTRVRGNGVACHQGYRSCFYRSVPLGDTADGPLELEVDARMKRITAT